MLVEVTYMSGAGNVFAVLDARSVEQIDIASYVTSLCNRTNMIGQRAEGVLVIDSTGKELVVHFFNPDGSSGMMCGNGARCAVQFARERALLPSSQPIVLQLADTRYTARIVGDNIAVEFPPPRALEQYVVLDVAGCRLECVYVDVGSDHVVLEHLRLCAQLSECGRTLDFSSLAPQIRYHKRFLHGVNVNLYHWQNGVLHLTTYERGVEAITGACGTGALATAVSAWLRRETIGNTVTVLPPSGERLTVEILSDGKQIIGLVLVGPARTLATEHVKLSEIL
ncbi:MAG: diaminopimelate epimerase [Chlorobi bacterium]|nr:diaminopimelate epimerase [Chlorobiota bacterium]